MRESVIAVEEWLDGISLKMECEASRHLLRRLVECG
jgi:hypothetical protein